MAKLDSHTEKVDKYFDGRIKIIVHAAADAAGSTVWCKEPIPLGYHKANRFKIVRDWSKTTCKECLKAGGYPNGYQYGYY